MLLPELRQLGAQCLFFFIRHCIGPMARAAVAVNCVLGWPQRFAKRLEKINRNARLDVNESADQLEG